MNAIISRLDRRLTVSKPVRRPRSSISEAPIAVCPCFNPVSLRSQAVVPLGVVVKELRLFLWGQDRRDRFEDSVDLIEVHVDLRDRIVGAEHAAVNAEAVDAMHGHGAYAF